MADDGCCGGEQQLRRSKSFVTRITRHQATGQLTATSAGRTPLPRDPTLRITFPDDEEQGDNALSPAVRGAFLGVSAEDVSSALVATLAFTGLRFCHASALRWEDVDFDKGIVMVVRKNGASTPQEPN